MLIQTYNGDFMLSSFDLPPDELCVIAGAVVSAMQMIHCSPWQPKIIINDYDEMFGNSVCVEYKYQKRDGGVR